jgi:sodium/bile acid cotransporter 7
MGGAIKVAIALLFFLYGTRLSAKEAWNGLRHWHLHGLSLLSTFALFPLIGIACGMFVPALLGQELYVGVLYLCVLPSTVQSSITFTSLARGNVASAICSASFSNVVGVILTPLLVGSLVTAQGGGVSVDSLSEIVLLLLVPFVLGQIAQRWVGERVQRHGKGMGFLDRGVILVVVYSAFSEGALAGVWHEVTPRAVVLLVLVSAMVLATMLSVTNVVAHRCGFSREDRIAAMFCGSKKSLASGLPMAAVLFAGPSVSLVVLPLMVYHQLQLIVCAWLARRFARTYSPPEFEAEAVRS